MPTLETIEVPIEPPKPKPSKPAAKANKRESNRVTPPTQMKETTTQPKQPKQLGLAAFFGKATKPKSPTHETPTIDPARRNSLANIVVGRSVNTSNSKPLDPTKKLDYEKKSDVVEIMPASNNATSTDNPATKKQKLDHSATVDSPAMMDLTETQKTVQTTTTPLVAEKRQTQEPESPDASLAVDTPIAIAIADKKITKDATKKVHTLDSDKTDRAEPSIHSQGTAAVSVTQRTASQSKITSFVLESPSTEKKSLKETPSVSKRAQSPQNVKDTPKTPTSRFYSVGDRLEVQWTIQSSNDEDQVEQRWWGATVREFCGTATVLEYDPYPEGGFDKASRETVTLTSHHTLLCNGESMYVRREGEAWTKDAEQDPTGEDDKRLSTLKKYTDRAKELLTVFKETLTSEPPLNVVPPVEETVAGGESSGFPDFAIKPLNALVEGRSEPLSVLTCIASEHLKTTYGKEFPFEETSSKIKVIATRKNILKDTPVVTGENVATPVDVFEDESPFWRWEVTVVDLLPTESLARVKKARASHKKISSHWNSLIKLIKALQNRSLNDKAWAKISQDEEKFLKYEREEVKARLAMQAKISKEQEKEKEKLMKQNQIDSQKKAQEEENVRLKEEKMLLKKEAAAEKHRKKEEAEKVKLQKQIEKENAEREKLRKQQLLAKQQTTLMSIFAPKKKEVAASDQDKLAGSPVGKHLQPTGAAAKGIKFDREAFHDQIAAGSCTHFGNHFKKLSKQARLGRKSQARRVTIPVDVTVYPENVFESEPYAERRDVEFRNKYKFLLFHEDIRPAYYGTWSKSSKLVTGRSPFVQDVEFLDYEYDSEGEWEEGDDEIGDECDDDACDEDEEKDEEMEMEDEDGWLAADDEIPEDLDEETKERLRKQYETKKREITGELTVCIIAPVGGKPVAFDCDDKISSRVEGFSLADAKEIMASHITETTNQIELCLDPFPPSFMDEPATEVLAPKATRAKEVGSEDQKIFVQYVHNSTIGSKDKLIDEFRSSHPEVTMSRAQAVRMLGAFAEKIKSSSGASCWRVKPSILSELDLAHLADTKVATESQEETLMKIVAQSIHHETIASKEKAVDELRLKSEVLKATSRAECLRILDAVATKKKKLSGGRVYWTVNDDVQLKLGLTDLPKDAPIGNDSPGLKVKSDDLKDDIPIDATTPKSPLKEVTDSEGVMTDSAQKKRKVSSSGSTKLMESFLKMAKTS